MGSHPPATGGDFFVPRYVDVLNDDGGAGSSRGALALALGGPATTIEVGCLISPATITSVGGAVHVWCGA